MVITTTVKRRRWFLVGFLTVAAVWSYSTILVQEQKKTDVRGTMKKWWEQFDASLLSMMLCSGAKTEFEKEDKRAVLKALPFRLEGQKVLELGAGIGRFTSELANLTKEVTAVDFTEIYVEKNRVLNSRFNNIKFIAADVTLLQLEKDSEDVIFSNWLMMYLSDEELAKVVVKMLSWVKTGGFLHIRESCNRPSGDVPVATNPTFYRSILDYLKAIQGPIYKDGDSEYSFVCQKASSVEPYLRHHGNPFQFAFVFRKIRRAANFQSSQEFLDEQEYTQMKIQHYEFVFGKTFTSHGGEAVTADLVKKLNLKGDEAVLDVGCGTGGSAFHMAKKHGVKVRGIDLSSNMISMAVDYQSKLEDQVKRKVVFEISDTAAARGQSQENQDQYDVILSKDAMFHIPNEDKESVFSDLFQRLKPGGKLVVLDYCHGDKKERSQAFLDYLRQNRYHMMKIQEYEQLLKKVGFETVVVENRTDKLNGILKIELKRISEKKEDFLSQFGEQEYDHLVESWNGKLKWTSEGDQTWVLFTAVKKAEVS